MIPNLVCSTWLSWKFWGFPITQHTFPCAGLAGITRSEEESDRTNAVTDLIGGGGISVGGTHVAAPHVV